MPSEANSMSTGPPRLLPEQAEQGAHPGEEGSGPSSPSNVTTSCAARPLQSIRTAGGCALRPRARRSAATPGISGPALREEVLRGLDGLEASRLQVDDVHLPGRVADDFVGCDVHPQAGLAGRDQHRVVVAEAVHGARAEARHEAHQAVFSLDPRRPAELVVREGDAGERRAGSTSRPGCRRPPGS